MPAMAGAYVTLDDDAVARAASTLNVMKRLGGSVGVALLAVVLERQLPGATGGAGGRPAPGSIVAEAFAKSFWWVLAFCALALVPAAFLRGDRPWTERRQRAPGAGITTSGTPSHD